MAKTRRPGSLVQLPAALLIASGRALAGALPDFEIAGARPKGLAVRPRDARPATSEVGAQILAGVFRFGGETLDVGPGGDPWNRPAPSRRFAAILHGFGCRP